jgi:purine-binding chemotaxis protein CheW
MNSEKDGRYITFSLGNQQHAIPLLQAKEFIGVTEATPVPQTADYFEGIINLRGQIISVFDLRAKLRLPKAGRKQGNNEASIIILNFDNIQIGMIVDSINSVLALTDEELGPLPTIEQTGQEKYVVGVARKDSRLTLILDIGALLNVQDFEALENSSKKAA